MKINMLKVIRTITAVLEKTSPSLAKKLAIKLFFSPRASKQRLPDIPDLQKHWCEYVKTDGSTSKCQVYTAGTGPTVLLVHGWEGSAEKDHQSPQDTWRLDAAPGDWPR